MYPDPLPSFSSYKPNAPNMGSGHENGRTVLKMDDEDKELWLQQTLLYLKTTTHLFLPLGVPHKEAPEMITSIKLDSTKFRSITSSNLFLFCSTIWNYQEEVLLSQEEEFSRVLEGSVISIARDSWWVHLMMKNMTGLQAIFKPFILNAVQAQTLWIKGLDSNNNNHITIQKNRVREMLKGGE